MKLPESVRRQFQRHGREGGAERARRLSADTRRTIARQAAIRRWIRARFGSPHFATMNLPGGAMIDKGLDDLAAGKVTPESLVVSLAAPRLQRESVPLPAVRIPDADRLLYRLLEETEGDLAHSRYLARLRQVASFADACRLVRKKPVNHAQ